MIQRVDSILACEKIDTYKVRENIKIQRAKNMKGSFKSMTLQERVA